MTILSSRKLQRKDEGLNINHKLLISIWCIYNSEHEHINHHIKKKTSFLTPVGLEQEFG